MIEYTILRKGKVLTNTMANKVWIKDTQKKIKIPRGIRILVRRSCNAVLVNEGITEPCEISVTFVDNEQIKQLNTDFRNKPTETDVLSFPLGENGNYDRNPETGAMILGDIVISLEKAQRQSELYGHSLQREVAFLTVHSMLHLLGYDHENGGIEAVRMREKEESTLTKLGLSRTFSYGVDESENN